MANVTHASLTGADLHEPKGVSTAAANTVYLANGNGSGTWTAANSVISDSSWTTGDTKLTFQTAAPAAWVLFAEGGTIGDGSSGGTVRANTDCQALFELFWNTLSNTICPVSGGRGASASADWSAHKAIQLPPMASRYLGVVGAGANLTSRTLGETLGAEGSVLKQSDLPNVNQAVVINDPGHTHGTTNLASASVLSGNGGSTGWGAGNLGAFSVVQGFSINGATTGITATVHLNGYVAQTIINTQSPGVFLNLLIKL
jgi:hypothetical protein